MSGEELRRYYSALDLEPGASPEQIKRAWRDLTKVWHPDRFQGDPRLEAKAEAKLKIVNEAYEKLSGIQSVPPVEPFPSRPVKMPDSGSTAPRSRPAASPPSSNAKAQSVRGASRPSEGFGVRDRSEYVTFAIVFGLSALPLLTQGGLLAVLVGGALSGALAVGLLRAWRHLMPHHPPPLPGHSGATAESEPVPASASPYGQAHKGRVARVVLLILNGVVFVLVVSASSPEAIKPLTEGLLKLGVATFLVCAIVGQRLRPHRDVILLSVILCAQVVLAMASLGSTRPDRNRTNSTQMTSQGRDTPRASLDAGVNSAPRATLAQPSLTETASSLLSKGDRPGGVAALIKAVDLYGVTAVAPVLTVLRQVETLPHSPTPSGGTADLPQDVLVLLRGLAVEPEGDRLLFWVLNGSEWQVRTLVVAVRYETEPEWRRYYLCSHSSDPNIEPLSAGICTADQVPPHPTKNGRRLLWAFLSGTGVAGR